MDDVVEKPLQEKKVLKKKTFKQKLASIRENITIEPILAFYVIPGALARLVTENLNLDKACRVNLQYGDLLCDALIARKGDNYTQEELAMQELVAGIASWKNIISTAIPSFLILFIGAWSDRTGKRKICILLPIIGELLMCLSNIVNTYYFYELPVEVTMFFEAFFPAITGGWITTYTGAFAYISDVSSEQSRTYRIGVATLCLSVGRPIGSVLSGILLDKIGYYGVFSLCSLIYLISISYGFICIKDPERLVMEKGNQNESSGTKSFIKTFFELKHAKSTLYVAFKKGPNHRRTKSILVLASIAFITGPELGEHTIRYMFTRYCFNWNALKYSFYNTFFICTNSIGALVSISLFNHRLKWHESVLGLISNFSKILGALTTGLARNTMDMYISVALETFNATSHTALRSISSKLCTSDELGKMTSIFNLADLVASMVFGPIYATIYRYTIKIDPGIVFYISTVLTLPPLAFFGWFFIQHKKTLQRARKNKIEDKTNVQELETKKKEEQLARSIDLEHEKIVID